MRVLKPIESRTLAIALALLALALAYLLLVHWWFTVPLRDVSRQMQPLREQQQRYTGLLAQRDTLQQQLARLREETRHSQAFFSGVDSNAATASLMQRVVSVVGAHTGMGPCTITQKMPIPTPVSPGKPYRKISANINMLCTMPALSAILYDLGYGQPVVFIDSFSTYRNQVRGRNGSASPLTVQMQVSGYMRQPEGEQP